MSKLSCAAMLLALGVSGAVSAGETGVSSGALLNNYWHCIYQAEPSMGGGLFEYVQRGTCALVIDDPFLGRLSLVDAYLG